MTQLYDKAKQIKCLICDVDGVLSDGKLYLSNNGDEIKAFHVQDGMGLKLLMHCGIEVAIITTSVAPIIQHRMKQLGIKHYYTGQINKQSAFETLQKSLSLRPEDFAYIGDDLPDLPIIKQVGMGVAVANAVPLVREYACWTTQKNGGNGAVRELCDLLMSAQDKTDLALNAYLADG